MLLAWAASTTSVTYAPSLVLVLSNDILNLFTVTPTQQGARCKTGVVDDVEFSPHYKHAKIDALGVRFMLYYLYSIIFKINLLIMNLVRFETDG